MRRLVLVCMLVLLPLQWGWAAAAAYCAHETDLTSKHFGHHEHKSCTAPAKVDGKASSLADLDTDCDYCHLSATQWIAPSLDVLMPSAVSVPPVGEPPHSSSPIPSGPERPDRLLAA